MSSSSPPIPSISRPEAQQNGNSPRQTGNQYVGISASGQARQHNGNVYNTNAYHYTIRQRRSDETLRESDRNKRFLKAAAEGQSRRAEYLHRLGADLDYKDEYEMTALHNASFQGFEDTVETLLQMGSDVNAHGDIYGTPLCLAAVRGRTNVVDPLVIARANIEGNGGLLGSPLHPASAAGDIDMAEKLIRLGCPINIDRLYSCDIIDDAIEGRLTTDLQGIRCAKSQPLLVAAPWPASVSTLDFLLQKGANVGAPSRAWIINKRDDSLQDGGTAEKTFEGITALMKAAVNDNAAGVLKLLDAGANPDLQDSDGRTAMMYAACWGNTESLLALIQRGANLNLQDCNGFTAMMYATNWGYTESLSALIQRGADVNIKDKLIKVIPRRYLPQKKASTRYFDC